MHIWTMHMPSTVLHPSEPEHEFYTCQILWTDAPAHACSAVNAMLDLAPVIP